MKNKEKYLTNFSEAKRKKAIQKYNIIKPFTLGEQSLASISKSKGIAPIHRKIANYCIENNFDKPSYKQVYSIIKTMPKSVIAFSHQGEKYYQNKYDLIQIRESSRPNEIWQADHTSLDIYILDQKGNINRPWLTIIMDDYSRAIAGYFISLMLLMLKIQH